MSGFAEMHALQIQVYLQEMKHIDSIDAKYFTFSIMIDPHNEEKLAELLRDPATRRQAFSEVIHLYQENLYWQIRKLVFDHEDASDLLQNTLLKAWQGLDNFRGDSRLSTWLYTIAHNETISFLNKRQAEQEMTIDDPDGYIMDSQEADQYFDGEEAQRLLRQAIQNLPAKQREVFVLRYFKEMPYEEISRITGTSVGALKASYHFAVDKISSFFHKNEI